MKIKDQEHIMNAIKKVLDAEDAFNAVNQKPPRRESKKALGERANKVLLAKIDLDDARAALRSTYETIYYASRS